MTSAAPLKFAILWHMHQPFYFDPETRKFRMPWVRLHATKDYLDMLLLTEKFEAVRPVFNFTPSLLQQIQMYLDDVPELHIELTLKDPRDLSPLEKNIILKDFFMANWDTMIKPFPRYHELLAKRGIESDEEHLREAQRFFSNQDFVDLQLLFNLVWVDPLFRSQDETLRQLVKKGRNYSADDKKNLIDLHLSIMARIFDAYGDAARRNKIEISASPFYHPILPLLIDNYVALRPSPSLALPARKFQYPGDARVQIESAVRYVTDKVGVTPRGMWPSEGSVSDGALSLIAECGLLWAATDEKILRNSLRNTPNLTAEQLYRSYTYESAGGPLNLFFRDNRLSDNIGFVYNRLTPDEGADHFLNSLRTIGDHLSATGRTDEFIVPVILDGENAWEFYQEDGTPFLTRLYEKIDKDDRLEMVTFSEFLSRSPGRGYLRDIAPGSWIDANFNIWIGHEEDNAAWDYLADARAAAEERETVVSQAVMDDVMNSLYIAEGSDWNWWYGDEHSTDSDVEFDELFRNNVKDAYRKMGAPHPAGLDSPIIRKTKEVKPDREMFGFVSPTVDGKVTSYFEWLGSYAFNLKKFGFAMHRTNVYFEALFVGFDHDNLYLRMDPEPTLSRDSGLFPLRLSFGLAPVKVSIFGTIDAAGQAAFNLTGAASEAPAAMAAAFSRILEIKVPLAAAGLKENDELSVSVTVSLGNDETIRFPLKGFIKVVVPPANFEEYIWQA